MPAIDTTLLMLALAAGDGPPPVQVIVDMDASALGFQSTIEIDACADRATVGVHLVDPLGTRAFHTIGYLGGIDRGIAFGHVAGPNANHGAVVGLTGTPVAPGNPGNTGWVSHAGALDPGFAGPEVQYQEWGAVAPATIGSTSAAPLFTIDIALEDTHPGDRFEFHLLDFVSVWTGGTGTGGAFSVEPVVSLDTGGDAVADGTPSLYGPDADVPVAVPPGAFAVDYIDGPAAIEIVAGPADVTADGTVDVQDLVRVILTWGPGGAADIDENGAVDVADLVAVVLAWGTCG